MTASLDQETLIAYVDGELDTAQTQAVEATIAKDPDLAATVETLRKTSATLRAAYNEALRAPVPARLTAFFDAPPRSHVPAARGSASSATRGRAWRAPFAAPIAASLVALMVGTGGAYVFSEWQDQRRLARLEADRQMIAAAVSQALETQVSGKLASWHNPDSGSSGTIEPVRTFRAVNGQWCREYIQTADLRAESVQRERRRAIACRDSDGQWRTQVEKLETS